MLRSHGKSRIFKAALAVLIGALVVLSSAGGVLAQAPPTYSPDQLDKMVTRIALYPDPLLAQVLAGATYPDQIPDAAKWADEHHYLSGDALAQAIDAVQRMRQKAKDYGYLQSNQQVVERRPTN
jgi:hypothetical protein